LPHDLEWPLAVKSVDDHLRDILSAVGPLPPRPLPLPEAHGCVLAEDVYAAIALPGFDNSAMDGYAVRAADVANASDGDPVRLPVVGDIPAGAATLSPVGPGEAARIMTGAPLPPGADAIVQVEFTDGRMGTVAVRHPVAAGTHVRRAGDDVAAGALVLASGSVLDAARIGLLAAVGVARPSVHPRPRVAVLSTGSELVEVGEPVGAGQIVDSNSHAVAAAAVEAGATAERLAGVPDDPARFAAVLREAAKRADVIVTTGGVSVGAYDVVKQVLIGLPTMRFDRVAMQPGKPQGFGTVEGTVLFTLPGNPVSALVSFELFARPALLRMRGFTDLLRPRVEVTVAEAITSPPGRRSFPRVRLESRGDGTFAARPAGGQGSHQMAALAVADALLVVPEDMTQAPVGTRLPAILVGAPQRDGNPAMTGTQLSTGTQL
jgi:molybdopterin molybdotransferase